MTFEVRRDIGVCVYFAVGFYDPEEEAFIRLAEIDTIFLSEADAEAYAKQLCDHLNVAQPKLKGYEATK